MKVKYPLAIVVPYGSDDKTVTKLAVSIQLTRDSEPTFMERWTSTDILTNPRVSNEVFAFMRRYAVKSVMTANVVLGCTHEEGEDYPLGEDCPFCPFWKGKQGSGTDDSRWDNLDSVRIERLGFSWRFWMPW